MRIIDKIALSIVKKSKTKEVKDFIKQCSYKNQNKPVTFSDLEYVFTDSKGKKYYQYLDLGKAHLDRLEELMIKIQEMNARVNQEELKEMITSAKVSFQGKLEKGEVPDLAWVGHLINEFEFRFDRLPIYSYAILHF